MCITLIRKTCHPKKWIAIARLYQLNTTSLWHQTKQDTYCMNLLRMLIVTYLNFGNSWYKWTHIGPIE